MHTLDHQALSDKEYRFLAKTVKAHAGIILEGERHRTMMQGRLIRRLRSLHIASFSDYCTLLQSAEGESETHHLINAVTTNVTAFFREPHHFDHLAEMLAACRSNPGSDKRIRLWSAACSSGEEPYSMAMTAQHCLKNRGAPLAGWDVKILATDIDTTILEKARRGEYPADGAESFPAGYADKYSSALSGGQLAIREETRRMVHFKQLNLLEKWPVHGPFDAIFCRNVFIYFTAETQHDIASRFASLLKPGGFLYIGHSENLMGLADKMEHVGKTIYRKL